MTLLCIRYRKYCVRFDIKNNIFFFFFGFRIQFFLVGSINIFDYFGATQIKKKKVLDAAHVGAQLLMSYISACELYLSVPTYLLPI